MSMSVITTRKQGFNDVEKNEIKESILKGIYSGTLSDFNVWKVEMNDLEKEMMKHFQFRKRIVCGMAI